MNTIIFFICFSTVMILLELFVIGYTLKKKLNKILEVLQHVLTYKKN